MRHSTPCYVRVEDAEKRKELLAWLAQIGYKVYDWHLGTAAPFIRCWTTPKGIRKAAGCPCTQVRKTDIDCGTDIELFKALAAMNYENDLNQWFTDGYEWILCPTPVATKSIIPSYATYRKATAEEIVKHFKVLNKHDYDKK